MTTPHPHANILRAIADGETIQWQDSPGKWHDMNVAAFLNDVVKGTAYHPDRYRVKPRSININGHEVPEPLRTAPAQGTTYWAPLLGTYGGAAARTVWDGGDYGTHALQNGVVHLTREAAQAHAEALLSFTASKD